MFNNSNENISKGGNEIGEEFPFHSTATPRGLKFYDLNVLTELQQEKLNKYKSNMVRKNQQYLENHPEIKAIVSLLLTEILKKHSYHENINDIAANYFTRPVPDLQDDIKSYLQSKGKSPEFRSFLDESIGSRRESAKSIPLKLYTYRSDVSELVMEESSDDNKSQISIDLKKSVKTKSQILRYLKSLGKLKGEYESSSLGENTDLSKKQKHSQKYLKRSGRRKLHKKKLSSQEYSSDYLLGKKRRGDYNKNRDDRKNRDKGKDRHKLSQFSYDSFADDERDLNSDIRKYHEIVGDIDGEMAGEYESNYELDMMKELNKLYSKINTEKSKNFGKEDEEMELYINCIC